MKTAVLTIALTLFLAAIQVVHCHHNNGTCSVPSDCHDGECCVYPTQARYVLPTCQKLGEIDSECRPGAKAEDIELPLRPRSNDKLKVVGAYRAVCPCQPKLKCNAGKCQQ